MKKLSLIFCLMLLPGLAEAKPYLNIEEKTTPKGLYVWTVRDPSVPVMALQFSLEGGARLDPKGKEGVGDLLTTLFDEGAGKYGSEEFQNELEKHGIRIGFQMGRDTFKGFLKTTTAHRPLALDLFNAALNAPHFTPEAVERMRQASLSALRQMEMDPGWMAQDKLFKTIFHVTSYARPVEGTTASLKALTVTDLKKQKDTLFCREALKIAVVGDIDPALLANEIDRLFGAWPSCSYTVTQPGFTLKHAGETLAVSYDGAQDVVLMAQPGLHRTDKDWWAARILDFALGGGEFSSRLLEEVRVKRGLTYGVSSSIATLDQSPLWMVQAGIDPAKTDEAIDVIKTIWKDVAQNGLKDEEIREAKDYLIGSLPLALTSTDKIAAILLQLQEDGLPKDTLDRRAAEIEAVTAEDIRRVARDRLKTESLTTVIVGPNKEKKK